MANTAKDSCGFHSLSQPITMDFTNIVDQGRQFPLDIHSGFRAYVESMQSLLDVYIGKYRLAKMNMRTVFLLRCSFYFFSTDLLTLLLIGGRR